MMEKVEKKIIDVSIAESAMGNDGGMPRAPYSNAEQICIAKAAVYSKKHKKKPQRLPFAIVYVLVPVFVRPLFPKAFIKLGRFLRYWLFA